MRLAGTLAVVGIFAFTGMRLLAGSQAEPLTPATTSLSLAPATIALKQGDLINVAVNMAVGTGDSAGEVKAVVTYDTGQLELQSVQQACPLPYFTDGDSESSKPGTAVITCKSESGVVATQTLATMVFRAVADTGEAPIKVDGGASTVVSRRSNKQRILQKTSDAQMALQPRKSKTPPAKRSTQGLGGKPVCAAAAPGQRRCHAFRGTGIDGRELNASQALAAGYGPQEYHMAYQMPCTPGGPVAAVCATPSTYGPTVVITDAGGYTGGATTLESDLQAFNQKYGIAACTITSGCLTVVNGQGATSPMPPDLGWSDEINMDVIAVHEMCQTCKIVVVLSSDAGSGLDKAHDFAARTYHPVAISDSWSGGGPSQASYFDHPGIAQVIADGDDGVLPNIQNYPVDYAGMVVASGTQLQVNTDGSWAGETLWSGSGGGCSPTEAAASWQTALPNWASAGCGSKRAYGDLAAAGGPQSAQAEYYQGRWTTGYGTSLSAPLIAAMFALANGNGLPSTLVTPSLLYSKFNASNSHDITTGSNCTSRTTTHCNAGAGYDVPTGMGAPYGVSGLTAAATTTPPTPPPTPPPTTPPPTTPPPVGGKKGDVNNDSRVNITDLSVLLSNWNKTTASCDLNANGKVDLTDLSILLSNWTG